jgi:carboxyl-terminal processing protease
MKIPSPLKIVSISLIAFLVLVVAGCGSSGSATADPRVFLYDQLRTLYLWAEYVDPDADPYRYADDEALLSALKYTPKDRFSFIMDKEAYLQAVSQNDAGDGLRGQYNENDQFVVYYVLDNSPAQSAGFRRGDIITSAEYTDETNTKIRYHFLRDGVPYNTVLKPASFHYDVVHTALFRHEERTIGYLRYDEFTSASYENIEKAFDRFSPEGIDDLILDLRYNAGGSVAIASILLDKIAGAGREGQPQFSLQYNAQNAERNELFEFETDDNSLERLGRIMILTTKGTASASELVINALTPYLEVVTIGSDTYGKPVGMEIKEYAQRLYFLVDFALLNADGYGDYFEGIAPTCRVEDDLRHALGDENESMTHAALYYLHHGSCP